MQLYMVVLSLCGLVMVWQPVQVYVISHLMRTGMESTLCDLEWDKINGKDGWVDAKLCCSPFLFEQLAVQMVVFQIEHMAEYSK